jgi:hypothetical protein
MVRFSETPKNDFQRRLLLDFVSVNIQSRPDYKNITMEEINEEIDRVLALIKAQIEGVI